MTPWLICFSGIGMAGEDENLEPDNGTPGQKLKSVRSELDSYVEFFNRTTRHVDILWCNYAGGVTLCSVQRVGLVAAPDTHTTASTRMCLTPGSYETRTHKPCCASITGDTYYLQLTMERGTEHMCILIFQVMWAQLESDYTYYHSPQKLTWNTCV